MYVKKGDNIIVSKYSGTEVKYEGTEYKEDKFFILPHLFGISNEAGQQITIYVNKTSPNYCLIQQLFYKNVVNWILLLLLGVWIYNIIKLHKKKKEATHESQMERMEK